MKRVVDSIGHHWTALFSSAVHKVRAVFGSISPIGQYGQHYYYIIYNIRYSARRARRPIASRRPPGNSGQVFGGVLSDQC